MGENSKNFVNFNSGGAREIIFAGLPVSPFSYLVKFTFFSELSPKEIIQALKCNFVRQKQKEENLGGNCQN